ncbi:MAG TPA: Ig-like domain-containing protein [Candidatus Nitrosopolaris sp.]|nr:Ig-like domain-containing protein [Candidatus Nitrosopolaris sp.]
MRTTTTMVFASADNSSSSSSGNSGSGSPNPSSSSSNGNPSSSSSGSSGGGSTAHCDRPGYPSCSSLGSAAGSGAPGTSCPPGHSKAYCKAYNSASGSPSTSPTPQVSTAHCDFPGYPSCYSLGYADGKGHPGTSCPSGHSTNYCKGYRAGAGSLVGSITTNSSLQADVLHCNQPTYPSCYSVGYQDGKLHPGAPCPSGHSADFCSGWNAGAGNTTHCDQSGWPSCYSIGYADGKAHPGTTCPSGHTQNYCSGWNAGAGNTAHCDQKGWPSCYDMGYLAGKAHPGTSCPPGHSKAYCNGYVTGAGNIPMIDTHCDTPNFPSCYSLGYQDGKNAAPGTPCPSGHSLNYCFGWQAGNPVPGLLPKCTIAVNGGSYKTPQNTPVDVTLAAQDNGKCIKPITMSIVSEPKDGSLKPRGTNQDTYTPNTGFIGTDSFQYQASDHNGTKSNVGTISITVGSTPATGGGLRIVSQSNHTDSAGDLHVVGEVENDKNVTAKFVEVIGTFYDVNDKVVGTSFTFTEPHDLAPGTKAPFDLILTADQTSVPISQIKRYSLQITSE